MWLKSALMNHYGIAKKGFNTYKKDKSADEMLRKIIEKDCSIWYENKYGSHFHKRFGFNGVSFKIDFDDNIVDAKIMMSYYTHKASNIHRLYNYLLTEKEYHTDLNDMIFDVTAKLLDERVIEIKFSYNKDKILESSGESII